jgi:hypothetical protein
MRRAIADKRAYARLSLTGPGGQRFSARVQLAVHSQCITPKTLCVSCFPSSLPLVIDTELSPSVSSRSAIQPCLALWVQRSRR